jgi:hypothetical protein
MGVTIRTRQRTLRQSLRLAVAKACAATAALLAAHVTLSVATDLYGFAAPAPAAPVPAEVVVTVEQTLVAPATIRRD